jgi:alpha-1,4-digalacturonate transport system permease protein
MGPIYALKRTNDAISRAFGAFYDFLVQVMDYIFAPIQFLFGVRAMPYAFVLPNLLIFGIFILFPMILNFVYAFTGGASFFPDQRPWVGTQNFERLLTCQDYANPNTCREDLFWRAAYNTVGYVVFQVGGMVLLALITALILNRNIKARGFFRSVFFYPVLLSPIVVSLIWKWILQENGLVNGVLTSMGYDKVPFLVNAQWAQFWVVMISIWAFMGFYTLILLAGLQSIPADLYEAASIDGASTWQGFLNITMPLLKPTMAVVLVLSLIRAVQVFDIVYVFTGGGPGTATLYLVQFIYNYGFASPNKQFGLAAAASLVMASVLIVLTIFQLMARREEN